MDSLQLLDNNYSIVYIKELGYYQIGVIHYMQEELFFENDSARPLRNGKLWLYDSKGCLREYKIYENGILHGKTRSFFHNRRTVKGRYKNGKKRGLWKMNGFAGKFTIYIKRNGTVIYLRRKHYHPMSHIYEEYMEPFE